jgi:hypothetical protein
MVLPAPRLADDAKRLAGIHVEGHAVDRVHGALLELDMGAQILDLQ